MRNLLLLTAALGMTGVASAQNTASVSQTGNGNDAELSQVLASTATVGVTGNDNDVFMTQSDSRATVTVNGDNNLVGRRYLPSGTPSFPDNAFEQRNGSEVDISQTGDHNAVLGGQINNSGQQTPGQNGATAMITQISSASYAGTGFSNELFVQQQSAGVDADVYQENTGSTTNFAEIRQNNGSGHYADMSQIGEGNDLRVKQGGGSNAQSEAIQDGDRNTMDIDQIGGGAATANARSTGDDNYVKIDQHYIGGPAQNATVTQDGDGNRTSVIQDDIDNGPSGLGHSATIATTGDMNTAMLRQLGSDHTVMVTVNGDGNRLEGLGGAGTAAFQDGSGHELTVMQTGNGNVIQSSQTGMGNTETVTQMGNGNSSIVTQN